MARFESVDLAEDRKWCPTFQKIYGKFHKFFPQRGNLNNSSSSTLFLYEIWKPSQSMIFNYNSITIFLPEVVNISARQIIGLVKDFYSRGGQMYASPRNKPPRTFGTDRICICGGNTWCWTLSTITCGPYDMISFNNNTMLYLIQKRVMFFVVAKYRILWEKLIFMN